jgi:hypothetical protein
MSTETAPLSARRCLHHPEREAVARCPECARFFCRECITEHDDRIICADCLRLAIKPKQTKRKGFFRVVRGVCLWGISVFLAWIYFYFAGRLLITIPSSFHEGTIWHRNTE